MKLTYRSQSFYAKCQKTSKLGRTKNILYEEIKTEGHIRSGRAILRVQWKNVKSLTGLAA